MIFTRLKLEIYLPESHLPAMQKALQSVDAGYIGNYDSCIAYSHVIGTWRPLTGARPYIGHEGEISEAPEIKIEVIIETQKLPATLSVIRTAHPYEEPLINVLPLYNYTIPTV